MPVETKVDMGKGNVILRTHRGVVAAEKKWSSTKVSGSGGGGYIHQGQGNISDVKITSSVTEHHEIHVRMADASEIAFQLANGNVMLREGQPVSVLQAQVEGGDEPVVAAVHNHATDNTSIFQERIQSLYRDALFPIVILLLAVGVVIYALAGSRFNPFFDVRFFSLSRLKPLGVFVVAGLAFVVAFPAWRAMRKTSRINGRLSGALGDAIRAMKQNHPQH